MSKVIKKYDLVDGISMVKGTKVLCVQTQKGLPKLWVMGELDGEVEWRYFVKVLSGVELGDKPGRYIGTYQQNGGDAVWHVFEVKKFKQNKTG